MTIGDFLSIAIIGVCLVLSLLLCGSETALAAFSRPFMLRLEKSGSMRAALVNRLAAARERMSGALAITNAAAIVAASALAGALLYSRFGGIGALYAAAIMTLLVVVLAQVLPRTIALPAADRMSLVAARPVSLLVRLLTPVLAGLETAVRWVLRRLGMPAGDGQGHPSAQDELRAPDLVLLESGSEKHERELIDNLRDLVVSDVMIHRTEMITVCADEPPEAVIKTVLAQPVTRVPLWSGSPENIIGILHAKDVLRAIQQADGDWSKVDVKSIARPAWFVPDIRPLSEQLKAFRRRQTPFAMVVDEYGEVMGLVTLADVLEEIVGDIADESVVALPGVRPQPDGSVNVDGGVPIRDLNRAMDWNLPDDAATTIAGLVIHESRSIPEPGQSFTFHGFRFRVLRRHRNRITALRIMPIARRPTATLA